MSSSLAHGKLQKARVAAKQAALAALMKASLGICKITKSNPITIKDQLGRVFYVRSQTLVAEKKKKKKRRSSSSKPYRVPTIRRLSATKHAGGTKSRRDS